MVNVHTRAMNRWIVVFPGILLSLFLLTAFCGCSANRNNAAKPTMGPGEGAISGQLVGPYQDPFDLKQAGDDAPASLRIDLVSPATGISAAAYPRADDRFVFSDVKPGQYELHVYWVVPGKRTIAGSLPVTVNPDEVTPVKMPLTVTSQENPQ